MTMTESRDHPDWWRPVGGQNSQDSTLERRSLIFNDDGVVVRADFPILGTGAVYKGKFFPRGCRGMIEEILIWRTATAAGTITLGFSPHPCLGPLYTVVIPAGPADAWTGVAFEQMWDYDSLFIWVISLEAGEEWGYDEARPYDGHVSEDLGATWADLAIRPFIRAVYTGQTPGDVPVSGTINAIILPNLTTGPYGSIAVIDGGAQTDILNVVGIGEVSALMIAWEEIVGVVPSDDMLLRIVLDGFVSGYNVTWIRNTVQNVINTTSPVSMGTIDAVNNIFTTFFNIPFKFRRSCHIYAMNTAAPGNTLAVRSLSAWELIG